MLAGPGRKGSWRQVPVAPIRLPTTAYHSRLDTLPTEAYPWPSHFCCVHLLLGWQTYDIQFRAARYNEAGEKIENARATVRHNGVIIHEDLELPQRTAGGPLAEGPEDGFLHLQDHSNPVRFRNIWVVEE